MFADLLLLFSADISLAAWVGSLFGAPGPTRSAPRQSLTNPYFSPCRDARRWSVKQQKRKGSIERLLTRTACFACSPRLSLRLVELGCYPHAVQNALAKPRTALTARSLPPPRRTRCPDSCTFARSTVPRSPSRVLASLDAST